MSDQLAVEITDHGYEALRSGIVMARIFESFPVAKIVFDDNRQLDKRRTSPLGQVLQESPYISSDDITSCGMC